VPDLPRALRTLGHEAVLTEDEPHPLADLEPSLPRGNVVVLADPCHSRAITSGHQRYAADSHGHSRTRLGWPHAADLEWRRSAKLHGMQGVSRMTTPTVGPNLEEGVRTVSS
jgi:hypothetical protein